MKSVTLSPLGVILDLWTDCSAGFGLHARLCKRGGVRMYVLCFVLWGKRHRNALSS